MATSARARPRPSRTDEQLAYRIVFKATWDFVWKALDRYHLGDEDREDITLLVVFKAWHKRKQFNEARGNEKQWLSGILRNEAAKFFRARGSMPVLVPIIDLPDDSPSEARGIEDDASLKMIAERALSFLPRPQVQVILLRLIDHLSFHEIAKEMGIAPSTAHLRYKRGMEALRRAIEDGEIDNPFAAALVGVGAATAGAEPPPEMEERAWQRAVVALGLDQQPPDSEPPASGPRRRAPSAAHHGEPPPSSRPLHGRSPWPSRLGLALLLLLGPGPSWDGGCDAHPTVAGAATPATTIAPATTDAVTEGAKAASLSPEAATTLPSASAKPPAPAPQRTKASRDDNDIEAGIMDRAQAALDKGNVSAAIDALVQHAQRFPRGHHVAERNAAWRDVCSRDRTALSPSAVAEMQKHCASR
jgi:RNA polymerase sigma-70 factor, ECF subfamily